ncbi:MAG: DUF5610 domain-containing protein, partial [Gammaproteobacteria bacterium]|nr:DUF5610 domain-containing protein [Gammaproteobacteria bacterium]
SGKRVIGILMINHITSSVVAQQTPLTKGRVDSHVENQVAKPSNATSLTNEASQRILNDKIIEKLDKVLQKDAATPSRQLDPADYTPEAVSKRILSFVQDAVDRAGQRGVDRQAVLDQAKSGIAQGFKDAKNILTSLNALSGAIAENVNKTYQQIQDGLKNIVDQMTSGAGSTNNVSRSALQASSYSSSQSMDLTINTREGDTLNLSISRDESTGQFVAAISKPDSEAQLAGSSYQLNQDFSLSVQGDINDAEVSAIQDLLGGIKGVADQFFSGNSEAALNTGLSLGYDSSQIASFSLNLNTEQTSATTKAYQEVSNLGDNSSDGLNREALNNLLKPVSGFMDSLHSMLSNAENSKLFDNSKDSLEQLLGYFSTANEAHKPAIQNLEAKAGAPFQNIVHDMLSKVSA